MKQKSPIPASPSEDDYVRQVIEADPLPLLPERDPIALFETWLAAATKREPNDPNAMTLATVDGSGAPDARMVLLKDVDPRGFTFYTNTLSAKGRELAAHPAAALVFHWKSLRRQVRVRGPVEPVSEAEADAYFLTRARPAQIGAWASDQSRELEGRLALEAKVAEVGLRFGLGKVPRPPHWSGYRVVPHTIEFWRDRPFRLHERLVFERGDQGWATRRLYP
jgi:pyridoxamine 5'-phosphate oxidase